RPMARQEVQKTVEQICDEMNQDYTAEPFIVFDKELFWNDYVDSREIQYTIIASQRMCYGAIYYAYEYFVLEVYRLVTKKPDYRINKSKEFRKDFAAEFGEP